MVHFCLVCEESLFSNCFTTVEYLKTVLLRKMACGRTRCRVNVHVEGRNSANDPADAKHITSDFEKVLTTELFGRVSRLDLLQHMCAWVCSENLLHEHSVDVSHNIINAVRDGTVQATTCQTELPLVGHSTSASLRLSVAHTLLHENVAVAFGSLCVAVPGDTLQTSVCAIRVECTLADKCFRLSAHISPLEAHGPYSECFRQTSAQCFPVLSSFPPSPLQARVGGKKTLSHRTHRVNCQQAHAVHVGLACESDKAQHSFCTQQVLSRKVSLISTQTNNQQAETIHTVFFR